MGIGYLDISLELLQQLFTGDYARVEFCVANGVPEGARLYDATLRYYPDPEMQLYALKPIPVALRLYFSHASLLDGHQICPIIETYTPGEHDHAQEDPKPTGQEGTTHEDSDYCRGRTREAYAGSAGESLRHDPGQGLHAAQGQEG